MNKIIFLFGFLLINCSLVAQSWNEIDLNVTQDLNEIYFVNNSKGFIVGNGGTLLKTLDAGQTWALIDADVSHDLTTITFLNDDDGFINGLRTTDGGETWEIQEATTNHSPINGFSMDNLIAGDRVAFAGIIYQSTDEGETWEAISDPIAAGFYTKLVFIGDSVGYMTSWYSGHIVKTTDAGSTWEQLTFPSGSDDLFGMSFINENTGIIAGNFDIILTNDGGDNWESILPSDSDEFYISNGVVMNSESHFVVVGRNSNVGTTSGRIYETEDGGDTWELTEASDDLNSVVCMGNKCFAIGENGVYLTKENSVVSTHSISIKKSIPEIYPNPVNSLIHFKEPTSSKFYIYNLNGIKLHELNQHQHTINVSDLNSGVYFLVSDIGGIVIKFIKE